MATKVSLELNEGSDEKFVATVTSTIVGFTLVGKTVEVYLKKDQGILGDTDVTTWKGSTATGEVVVTSATTATVTIPAVAVTKAKRWWRIDVIDAGLRKNAAHGSVLVNEV